MKIWIVLFLICLITPAQALVVDRVVDGDTVVLTNHIKVRVWGIDAPEISQPYGELSRLALEKLVRHQDIQLDCPSTTLNRPNCRVFILGTDVALEMVRQGLAYDYTQYSKGFYKAIEQEAQQKRLGLWQQVRPIPPWEFRHR